MLGVRIVDEKPWISQVKNSPRLGERVWRRVRKHQLSRIDRAIGKGAGQPNFFASDLSPHGAALANGLVDADLIHLHWVCDLIDYPRTLGAIPESTPIVWTLHDMGVFTGGCSHAFDCEGYQDDCANCPQLEPAFAGEAAQSLRRRQSPIDRIRDRLTIVAPSEWIAHRSQQSKLLAGVPHRVIANGIDLDRFHPRHRSQARADMGLGDHEVVLLFVSAGLDTPLKGISVLQDALVQLDSASEFRVCFVGPETDSRFPEDWRWLGNFATDAEMAAVYAAADVLIVPSLADNFPNVICEALACGLPVVGSRVGGIPELVIDGETGFLAEPGNALELQQVTCRAIEEVASHRANWSDRCRRYAESHLGISRCVAEHSALYGELLDRSGVS